MTWVNDLGSLGYEQSPLHQKCSAFRKILSHGSFSGLPINYIHLKKKKKRFVNQYITRKKGHF